MLEVDGIYVVRLAHPRELVFTIPCTCVLSHPDKTNFRHTSIIPFRVDVINRTGQCPNICDARVVRHLFPAPLDLVVLVAEVLPTTANKRFQALLVALGVGGEPLTLGDAIPAIETQVHAFQVLLQDEPGFANECLVNVIVDARGAILAIFDSKPIRHSVRQCDLGLDASLEKHSGGHMRSVSNRPDVKSHSVMTFLGGFESAMDHRRLRLRQFLLIEFA